MLTSGRLLSLQRDHWSKGPLCYIKECYNEMKRKQDSSLSSCQTRRLYSFFITSGLTTSVDWCYINFLSIYCVWAVYIQPLKYVYLPRRSPFNNMDLDINYSIDTTSKQYLFKIRSPFWETGYIHTEHSYHCICMYSLFTGTICKQKKMRFTQMHHSLTR